MDTVSQRKLYPRLFALALLLLAASLITPGALAAEHELGVALSSFSPADERTEGIFGIDSGPIPSLFYRYQRETHVFLVSAGFESWSRVEDEGSDRVETELEFVPIVGSYRYLPRHDERFSFFVGGGIGVLIYDASATGTGVGSSFLASETGAVASIEPLAGIEIRAGSRIRIHGEVKYSWQLATASDLDLEAVILDVDLGGFYATLGVSVALTRP